MGIPHLALRETAFQRPHALMSPLAETGKSGLGKCSARLHRRNLHFLPLVSACKVRIPHKNHLTRTKNSCLRVAPPLGPHQVQLRNKVHPYTPAHRTQTCPIQLEPREQSTKLPRFSSCLDTENSTYFLQYRQKACVVPLADKNVEHLEGYHIPVCGDHRAQVLCPLPRGSSFSAFIVQAIYQSLLRPCTGQRSKTKTLRRGQPRRLAFLW